MSTWTETLKFGEEVLSDDAGRVLGRIQRNSVSGLRTASALGEPLGDYVTRESAMEAVERKVREKAMATPETDA